MQKRATIRPRDAENAPVLEHGKASISHGGIELGEDGFVGKRQNPGYKAPELVQMRILFVTATRIGDAVLSTGLLSYVIERYPRSRLTIAAGPAAAPLFEAAPGLERLAIIEKRRWSLHWLPFYSAVATRRWDLVVDLRGSVLAYLLRANERRVMAKGDPAAHRVQQLARLFALDPPPPPVLVFARKVSARSVAVP